MARSPKPCKRTPGKQQDQGEATTPPLRRYDGVVDGSCDATGREIISYENDYEMVMKVVAEVADHEGHRPWGR